MFGGQDVSLPPEISLIDLHGLARRLSPVLQVVPASEQKLSLSTVRARMTEKKTPRQNSGGQSAPDITGEQTTRRQRANLLGLDTAALQQLVQRTEESAGAGDRRVARFDATLHACLRHPVHHATGEGKTQILTVCYAEAPQPMLHSQFQEVQMGLPLREGALPRFRLGQARTG